MSSEIVNCWFSNFLIPLPFISCHSSKNENLPSSTIYPKVEFVQEESNNFLLTVGLCPSLIPQDLQWTLAFWFLLKWIRLEYLEKYVFYKPEEKFPHHLLSNPVYVPPLVIHSLAGTPSQAVFPFKTFPKHKNKIVRLGVESSWPRKYLRKPAGRVGPRTEVFKSTKDYQGCLAVSGGRTRSLSNWIVFLFLLHHL